METSSLKRLGLQIRRAVRTWIKPFSESPDFNVKTLRGACAIASVALQTSLERVYDRKSDFVTLEAWDGCYCTCHCWVEMDDIAIDITATQFGNYPAVFIVAKENYLIYKRSDELRGYSHSFYRGQGGLDRLWDWRVPQCPFDYQPQINEFVERLKWLESRSFLV